MIRKPIFVLAGPTLSGKTTLLDYIVQLKKAEKVVTITTRPMRPGEVDGIDYMFITNEQFLAMRNAGEIIASRSYVVANGEIWYYGIEAASLDEYKNPIVITDLEGIKDLMSEFGAKNVYVFSLEIQEETQMKRLEKRAEANKSEQLRRVYADKDAFAKIKNWSDLTLQAEGDLHENAVEIINVMGKLTDRHNQGIRVLN